MNLMAFLLLFSAGNVGVFGLNYTDCRDIFSSSVCDAHRKNCDKYPYVLKNCRKTCKNCTITSTPMQTTTIITTATTPHDNSLATTTTTTTPLTSIVTKNKCNNTYTHSGSLYRCAPTSLMTAVFLWILGSQVLGLVE